MDKKSKHIVLSTTKRTKIVATVGPSTGHYEGILALIKAGANGLRLNFSHGNHAEFEQIIKWIRKASKETGKPVAIIQDLHGPKMQLGDFEGVFPVEKGQQLLFKYNADLPETGILPTRLDLSSKVKRGQRLLIADGKIRSTITAVRDGVIYAHAENEGVLIKNKGINLPDTDFEGDVIPKKDREDVVFGSGLDVDYVAQSFVQTAQDVRSMRKIMRNLNSNAKLIAKIETQTAIDDLENIIDEADGVMVARGDLAVEASMEVVPVETRRIVAMCRAKAKPVIIATQMMASMTESSEPTRAEVSDVATAVIMGTDAIMLSEETAVGKHAIHTVATMKKIARYTEHHSPVLPLESLPAHSHRSEKPNSQEAISLAIVGLADNIKATAIVAETKSGATAIQISSKRPDRLTIAVTSDKRVANQLAIVYGVKSFILPDSKQAAFKLTNWLEKNQVLKKGDVIITASGKYPGVVGTTDTIKVRVL